MPSASCGSSARAKRKFGFCGLEIVLLLERDTKVVVRDGGIGVAAKDFAEVGGGTVEVGLLQMRESGVDTRHVVARIRGEDLLELGQTFFGTSAVDEHEAEIVAGVEIVGRERDSTAVGFDGGSGVAGALAREAELVPCLGGFRVECRWRQQGWEARRRIAMSR